MERGNRSEKGWSHGEIRSEHTEIIRNIWMTRGVPLQAELLSAPNVCLSLQWAFGCILSLSARACAVWC
jgi:hypothetical protein